jgi:hypothetical protein
LVVAYFIELILHVMDGLKKAMEDFSQDNRPPQQDAGVLTTRYNAILPEVDTGLLVTTYRYSLK